jgi:hypothetical protein
VLYHVHMVTKEVLPENLRSELLKSFGRGEIVNYHRSLLDAIDIWRQLDVWRVSSDEDV